MAITPLPTPPSRADSSTFAIRADTFLGALPAFATEANALQTDVNAKQVTASAAAVTATEQAVLATTNGQTQVALATEQAVLATTNGQTQVALATEQVALATTQANISITGANTATTKAVEAVSSAIAAEASRIAASKLNLGNKVTPPTVDNQGGPLMPGATYYDTTLNQWRVWNGAAWVQGISAIAGVSSFNGLTGDVIFNSLPSFESGVI